MQSANSYVIHPYVYTVLLKKWKSNSITEYTTHVPVKGKREPFMFFNAIRPYTVITGQGPFKTV